MGGSESGVQLDGSLGGAFGARKRPGQIIMSKLGQQIARKCFVPLKGEVSPPIALHVPSRPFTTLAVVGVAGQCI